MPAPSLQQEVKKRRPFESPAQEAYLNLVRTTGHLSGQFHALFKEHGLSETSYNVLRILRGARQAEGVEGLPCLEVAERLITRVPDITRLVNRLVEVGLVVRAKGEVDRRVSRVCITEAGLAVLAELDRPVRKLHRDQLAHLSEKELVQLNRLLEKARSAADASAG
jgi:DNA-binding MarR family transcriptional regulator